MRLSAPRDVAGFLALPFENRYDFLAQCIENR